MITITSIPFTLMPPAPVLTDTSFLEPTPAFRQQVLRTLLGIVGFVLLYVALIAVGVGIA